MPKTSLPESSGHIPNEGEGITAVPVHDTAATLHTLQQAAGNQAVSQLLSGENEYSPAQVTRSAGQPLDTATRANMEARFGQDFSQVQLHTDKPAHQSAEALHADAYTLGNNIVLGANSKSLQSPPGQQLLAHELAHVVQQQGAVGTKPTPGQYRGLETEAEQAASSVQQGQSVSLSPAGVAGVQRRAKTETDEKETGTGEVTTAPAKEETQASGSGLLDTIWSGLKGAGSAVWEGMKTAGTAVWEGVKTAGSAVWEGMKTLGGWIATGAEAVWGAIKWVGRQMWDKITGIFARVMHWVEKLPERIGRLFSGLWQGLLTLKPWSLDWWKSLGKLSTWGDFLKWLGARAVDLLEILGLGEAYETLMDFVKFNTRTLTSEEIAKASTVFGASIDYKLVRLDEGALLGPSWTKRDYTSFHTINSWGKSSDDVLIHELTHVWQYETAGAIYMPQAIHAQAWGEGYDYGGIPRLQATQAAGKGIAAFNREQQAQIVQDFYLIKHGGSPIMGTGTVADLPLYAYFVKDVSTLTEAQLLA